VLEQMVKRKAAAWWIDALEAVGVPCGPIQDLGQVFKHPQVLARELGVGLDRDGATVRTVANPIRLSATPVRLERAPPALGADTDEILSTLGGLTIEALAALRHDGVV
jgi:crotonobetainyl-CoA:carnitine CoA-transferase CaiB-like acyl-CoA transferase